MKVCEACKSIGNNNSGEYTDPIFLNEGHLSFIRLCYKHSVELFKIGQRNFVAKYEPYIPEPQSRRSNPLQNYFVFNSFR